MISLKDRPRNSCAGSVCLSLPCQRQVPVLHPDGVRKCLPAQVELHRQDHLRFNRFVDFDPGIREVGHGKGFDLLKPKDFFPSSGHPAEHRIDAFMLREVSQRKEELPA